MSARILIIEDNPTNMELMVYLLTAFGYTPMTATDGESGVEAARASVPDLIISDIHLPKLDGYGVVNALKADPALRHIPVLAVTALAMVGDRERLLLAGFDGYIGKPIEPDTFVAQLETVIEEAAAARARAALAPPVPAGSPVEAVAKPTILLVDDHVLNREFLRTLLGFGGYRLLEAPGGADALKMAAAERPDLVISDILMPHMDGYEFVRSLRAMTTSTTTTTQAHQRWTNCVRNGSLSHACAAPRDQSIPRGTKSPFIVGQSRATWPARRPATSAP